MDHGGSKCKMDAAAELGRSPVNKQQIQSEYGNEQADAGRHCRTRLARLNSQASANADRKIFIFPVQLTTYRVGNLTRLIHTLAISVTIYNHVYLSSKYFSSRAYAIESKG